jgi:hypothetical protein
MIRMERECWQTVGPQLASDVPAAGCEGICVGRRPYEATIIAAAAHQSNLGAGNGNWQALIPSTPLPD